MKFKKSFFASIFFALFFSFVSVSAQIKDPSILEMTKPFDAFRIAGNVYYVGSNDVTSFLITSPKGHIIIDSGFEETVPIIEKGVAKLGFKMEDIKIILINHAHWDHCGGLKMLKEKTGARIYSVQKQADVLKTGGFNDFRFGGEQSFQPVEADKIIKDGEIVSLGGNELLTHLTPGHTKGATTWTMKVTDNGAEFLAIFLSSLSNLDYNLVDNKKYPGIGSDFESTFTKLKKIRPDFFLGSHAGFFKMEKKRRAMKEGAEENPFIDPEGYKEFVERMEQDFNKKREAQKKN